MLAGRSLPMVLSSSALFATWFGSETIFGASSEFLSGGLYAVIEDPFGAALCLLLFGLFFARKLYGMNLLTLGDFFRIRFGRKPELLACVFMVPSYFGYAAGQMVALGLILNAVTGVAVWEGVLIGATVVTLYTYVGGMWAISVTDFIQSIVIIAGLVVLSILLSDRAGGIVKVVSDVPEGTFKFFPDAKVSDIITYMAAWSVLGLGSIPSQDVFQRVMSSGSSRIAVRSCFFAAILYLTVAMLPLFISLCAKQLYSDNPVEDTQLVLPFMVLAHTPLPIQVLFFGSLLSAIMSTTSSAILAPAAILSENIVKPLFDNRLTDRQLLVCTRVSILTISALSAGLAFWKTDIYELVAGSSIMSLVSLFVPMAMGMYWKPAKPMGALLSMIAGMVTWIYFEFQPLAIPALVPALIASFAGMLIGSYWPDKRTYQLKA